MNNREPLEAAMVGTANFLSKAIIIILRLMGITLIVFAGFLIGLISGALRKK
jgi:hypothetical protein